MRLQSVKLSPVDNTHRCIVLLAFLSLMLPFTSNAQRKWSVDLNVGLLQPIGKDATSLYFLTPSISVEYYTNKKFNHPYFAFLPNLHYALTSKLSFGVQSGIYTHFNEHFSGYRKPILVTVPILATGRAILTKIKKNNFGINVAAGKNFFSMDTYPYDIKNGWLYNGSFFYQTGKGIVKLGIERQVDKGYFFYTSDNQIAKDQTIQKNLRRTAVSITYGYTINNH
jgi:hypothetical protein